MSPIRCIAYVGISLSYVPDLDNSDSPSIVEQLLQGPSLVYNTFISDSSQLLIYPMPYALFLASCSMGSPMFLIVP